MRVIEFISLEYFLRKSRGLNTVTPNNFTLMVPIYKETKALLFAKFYYDQINVKPLWILDSKAISRRVEVENAVGEKVEIFENDAGYLEEYYQRFAALSPTDWILRVDCDEIPSSDLLRYCNIVAAKSKLSAFGIERHELAIIDGRITKLKLKRYEHCQWRMFNRLRVNFYGKVHTPGFKADSSRILRVPRTRPLFHFDRVFNTQVDRFKKSTIYSEYGQLPINAKWFETVPEPDQFGPFSDNNIVYLFKNWQNSLGR